jgi:hypothetical protein
VGYGFVVKKYRLLNPILCQKLSLKHLSNVDFIMLEYGYLQLKKLGSTINEFAWIKATQF